MEMHPQLLEWLQSFDKDCATRASEPTWIYSSVVMLGVDKPNRPCLYSPGVSPGCDCGFLIASCENDTKHAIESIDFWEKFDPDFDPVRREENLKRNRDRIAKNNQEIEFHTWLHTNHAVYNRRVWEILAYHDLIAKVRVVCLRDNRKHLRGKGKTITTYKNYGEELATFLLDKPEGWF